MLQELEKQYSKNRLHHAYLIEGDAGVVIPELKKFLEGVVGTPLVGHPDVFEKYAEQLTIADSHELRNLAAKRPLAGDWRLFIITAKSFTPEAGQALLKIFEDPPLYAIFFLIVPTQGVVMPTLRSRCYVISSKTKVEGSARAFLSSSVPKRFSLIEEILKGEEENRENSLKKLLNSVVISLREECANNPQMFAHLESAYQLERGAVTQTAALRLVLEHLALTLPQLKM